MTTIPPEAIEAAVGYLPGIPTDNRERQLRATTMRAALTAAAPHIEAAARADERERIESDIRVYRTSSHYARKHPGLIDACTGDDCLVLDMAAKIAVRKNGGEK